MAKQWDYNVDDCRAKLDPSKAGFLSRSEATSVPLNNEKEVRIAWAFSVDDNFSNFEHFFDDYTWATNKKKQGWVEAPVIDGVPLLGKWRHAFTTRIERQDDRGKNEFLIVVTLRLGWAEAINWDEARVRKGHVALSNTEDADQPYGSDDATVALDVEFPNFSPFHSVAAGEALPATRDDFTVNGNPASGTFHKQMADVEEQEDGTHILVARYSKPTYTLTGFRSWLLAGQSSVKLCWGVPKDIAQEIITSFTSKGYSVEPSFSKDQELVNLRITMPSFIMQLLADSIATNTCDRFWYSSMYSGVHNPDLYTIPGEATAGVQYDRDIRFNATGSYDIVVRKGVRQHRAYDWRNLAVSTLEIDTIHEQMGVTQQDIIDISTPPRGSLYRQDVDIKADCSKDVSTRQSLGIYEATNALAARETVFEEDVAVLFQNMHDEPDLIGPATRGYVYATESSINRFGYYDGRKRAVRGKEAYSSLVSSRSALSSTQDQIYRNSPEVIEADTRNVGQRTGARSTLNEFGYYDGQKSLEEAVVASHNQATTRAATSIADASLYRNSINPVEADTVDAGSISSASSSLNDFGYYDGQKETTAAIYVQAPSVDSGASLLETEITDTVVNSPEVLATPAAAAGIISSASSSLNRFGYYDGNRRYQYAQYDNTGLRKDAASLLSDSYSDIFVNSPEHPTTPTAQAGVIYEASSSLNRYGYYDGRYNATSAIYASTGLKRTRSDNANEVSTERLVNSDIPLSVIDAPRGARLEATSSLNRFGYYDGQYSVLAAQYAAHALASARAATTNTDSVLYQNNPEQISAPSVSAGSISEASSSLNDVGYYDGRASISNAVLVEAPGVDSGASKLETEITDTVVNSPVVLETPAALAGVLSRASSSLNRFGYYDGNRRYQYAQYDRTGLRKDAASVLSDSHSDRFVNSPEHPDTPTAEAGTLFESSSSLNRYGYYDGQYNVTRAIYDSTGFRKDSASKLLESHNERFVNSATHPTVPVTKAGVIFEAASSLNRYGYYDGQYNVTLAIYGNTGLLRTDSDFRSNRFTDRFLNSTAPVSVPAATRGLSFSSTSSLNRFGYYDGIYSYETSENAAEDFRFVSSQSGLQTGYDSVYSENATVVEAPADSVGVIFTAQNTLTRLGYYNGVIRETRSTPEEHAATTLDSSLFIRKALIYTNKTTDIEVPPAEQGVIYAASSQIQPDLTFRGAVNTTLSVEREVYTPFRTGGRYGGLYVFRNKRSLPTAILEALDVYNSTSPSISIQDDNTFNGVISTRSSDGSGIGGFFDDNKNMYKIKYRRVKTVALPLGADQKRTWHFKRYYKYAYTYLNVLTKVSDSWSGANIAQMKNGVWSAVYDVLQSGGTWVADP